MHSRQTQRCQSCGLTVSNKTTSKHSERARQPQWDVVWLADNGIRDEGARGLSDALKTNTTLTQLDLVGEQQDHKETHSKRARQPQRQTGLRQGNRIGVEGARVLGDALKTNTALTQLWLGGEQQDRKETTREQGNHTMARKVTGRQQDWC